MKVILLILAILALAAGAIGWLMMIAIGIVHADVLSAVRPAGFGTGLALGVVLSLLFGGAQAASKS